VVLVVLCSRDAAAARCSGVREETKNVKKKKKKNSSLESLNTKKLTKKNQAPISSILFLSAPTLFQSPLLSLSQPWATPTARARASAAAARTPERIMG
jgi:hypothetical protein